jgi:hypothetical protein
MEEVKAILSLRGNAPRLNRNTLIFLAADRTRIDDLKQATRLFMAWESIDNEHEILNLDAFQRKQAKARRDDAEQRIFALIPETYSMILYPDQPNPRKPDEIKDRRLPAQNGLNNQAIRISKWLRDEELLITQFSGVRLRQELDRIPLWRGDHVSVKELTEVFARYIYLPRLKSTDVLIDAIRQGVQSPAWQQDTFAYASAWDAEKQRYVGLQAGSAVNVIVDSQAVLVKSDIAYAQLVRDEEERRAAQQARASRSATPGEFPGLPNTGAGGGRHINGGHDDHPDTSSGKSYGSYEPAARIVHQPPTEYAPNEQKLRRFVGSVQINERLMGTEAGRIMDEVVRHLTALSGSKVTVTIDISAEIPDGVPEQTVRIVKENGNTLRFDHCDFYDQ